MPEFLRLSKGGELIEFLTLGELAKECKKSKAALKSLIRRDILPGSNFVNSSGNRLYSREFLAPKIKHFMSSIKQGKKITLEQRSEIMTIFQDEKLELNR